MSHRITLKKYPIFSAESPGSCSYFLNEVSYSGIVFNTGIQAGMYFVGSSLVIKTDPRKSDPKIFFPEIKIKLGSLFRTFKNKVYHRPISIGDLLVNWATVPACVGYLK